MFFCHNRTQESFPDTSKTNFTYYHNLAVCLWLTGNTELQHPSVISFRNQVDQLWVPGEPSGSACEHQGSHTNQQEQFGKTVHFTDTGRKVAGFKRWIFVLSCPVLSSGLAIWRQRHPADQDLSGFCSCQRCCFSWLQSDAHHQCQTACWLLFSFCLNTVNVYNVNL